MHWGMWVGWDVNKIIITFADGTDGWECIYLKGQYHMSGDVDNLEHSDRLQNEQLTRFRKNQRHKYRMVKIYGQKYMQKECKCLGASKDEHE